jgi:hypothetical protein
MNSRKNAVLLRTQRGSIYAMSLGHITEAVDVDRSNTSFELILHSIRKTVFWHEIQADYKCRVVPESRPARYIHTSRVHLPTRNSQSPYSSNRQSLITLHVLDPAECVPPSRPFSGTIHARACYSPSTRRALKRNRITTIYTNLWNSSQHRAIGSRHLCCYVLTARDCGIDATATLTSPATARPVSRARHYTRMYQLWPSLSPAS